MPDEVATPTSEEEIRDAGARIKRIIRISVFVYTPLIVAFFFWLKPDYWGLIAAAFIVLEFGSYPFMIRSMNNATEKSVAKFREEHGLTPASNYPDVGV